MSLELKAPKDALKTKRIVGRGAGSGRGKTSKRGHKGYKQRAGSSIRLAFEGGQMALIRKLPKYGFSNGPHKKYVEEISLDQLEKNFLDGSELSIQTLKEKGLINKNTDFAKVLGNKAISKKLTVLNDVFVSKSAKSAIERAGGIFKTKPAAKEQKD